MKNKSLKSRHSEKGFLRLLSMPWVYNLFGKIIVKKNLKSRIVEEYIKPFPGCRILDIGCGPGDILSYLPASVGEYVGFDMNPSYIRFAKKQWGAKTKYHFHCQKIEDMILQPGYFDIVLAIGIVHHLNKVEAFNLFNSAYKAIKAGGSLFTYDGVYIESQHWFEKWLISKDRGKAVRTVEGYKRLAEPYFDEIEDIVLFNTLIIPYTILAMRCYKNT